MKNPGDQEESDAAVIDRLRGYTALDNPVRLRAFCLIHDSPGMPFNEIARTMRVESGLLAYHVGVLKAAGVIDVAYERDGRQVTSYRLTPRGQQLYLELYPMGRKTSRKAHTTIANPAAAR